MKYFELTAIGQRAKKVSGTLAICGTDTKNAALHCIADSLITNAQKIIAANAVDVDNGRTRNFSKALLDRLCIDEQRIRAIADGIRKVSELPDPIGDIVEGWTLPNNLEIRKVRVPLGVICIIFESRPNVTADAAALCLKSGNVAILRGGKEAINTNVEIVNAMRAALASCDLPEDYIQLVTTTDRAAVHELLRLNQFIDVVIPRGGAGLIKMVLENSSIPVIETGTGVCHTFVDSSADLTMALAIAINAKVSRPAVCNAMETLLIHCDIADKFMPQLIDAMLENAVELRGCARSKQYNDRIKLATSDDWAAEFLDLILAVKIVDNVDEAIAHIDKYSTGHSEAIITNDYFNAQRFQREIDAAAVYVNASTRFTDGCEFGFGAEIGISTQKLHARGPMGLKELTSIKYLINGSGQIR
ncbi:MAG: glutamate-5-semialdehyde dehydrogenase [Negativicutes bacterium]|jgi:glutamate-5-semialdehyde dehydrogenase